VLADLLAFLEPELFIPDLPVDELLRPDCYCYAYAFSYFYGTA